MLELLNLPYVGACLGGVVWAIRQEGRINGVEKLSDERDKQADERHTDLKDRLVRIEAKLDRRS